MQKYALPTDGVARSASPSHGRRSMRRPGRPARSEAGTVKGPRFGRLGGQKPKDSGPWPTGPAAAACARLLGCRLSSPRRARPASGPHDAGAGPGTESRSESRLLSQRFPGVLGV